MAATYPLEVVQATRWLQDPTHAALSGPALAAALDLRPWDPSVKALVPFPEILRMMDGSLEWTEAVGDAFLSDQAAVMDAIQRLRQRAQSAGTLVTTTQQIVVTADQPIGIIPADPQVVYVPMYDPGTVYGTWVYAPSPFYGYPSLVGAPLGGSRLRCRHRRRVVVLGLASLGLASSSSPRRQRLDHPLRSPSSPGGHLAARPGPSPRDPLSGSGNARALRGPIRRRAWLQPWSPGKTGHSPGVASRHLRLPLHRGAQPRPASLPPLAGPAGAPWWDRALVRVAPSRHRGLLSRRRVPPPPRDSCSWRVPPPARSRLRVLRAGRRRTHTDRARPVEPEVHRSALAAGPGPAAIKRRRAP